jgi:hypothetical protein
VPETRIHAGGAQVLQEQLASFGLDFCLAAPPEFPLRFGLFLFCIFPEALVRRALTFIKCDLLPPAPASSR